MPGKSKKQQQAAGIALSAKKGERTKTTLRGASSGMYESMNQKQLRELASTARNNLPDTK